METQVWTPGPDTRYLNYTSHAPKFAIVEDFNDVGTSKRRPRSFTPIKRHSFTLTIGRSEWPGFERWVQTILRGGVLPFKAPHPLTREETDFRFVISGGTPYNISNLLKNRVDVAMTWEEV